MLGLLVGCKKIQNKSYEGLEKIKPESTITITTIHTLHTSHKITWLANEIKLNIPNLHKA